jgi:hypothetical protein
MSDARFVGFDTRGAALMLQALADTKGMSPPEQAAFWLERIAAAVHRGARKDTWSSARDRAAKLAGIEATMAKRIWQRWRDMKFVDGGALMKLMVAYEAIYGNCEAVGVGYGESIERSRRMEAVAAALEEARGDKVDQRRRPPLGALHNAGVA